MMKKIPFSQKTPKMDGGAKSGVSFPWFSEKE
jgi:hypothetical protein